MQYNYKTQELVDKGVDFSKIYPEKQSVVKEMTGFDFNLESIVLFLKKETDNYKIQTPLALDLDKHIYNIYLKSIKNTKPTESESTTTKIDKSVLLIKIKLFKKALEKDKGNKVLKIKIKLFEKELTKYAYGGGVDGEYTYKIISEVSIQNEGKKFEKRMNVWGGNVFVNGESRVFIPLNYDTKEEAEARAKKIIEELKQGKFKGYNLINERLLDKYSRGYAKGGGVGTIKERVIDYYINNSDNEDLINLMGVSDIPNLKQVAEKWVNNRDTYYDKIFNAIDGIHNRTWGENKFVELGLEKFANGGGVGEVYKLIDGENTWYLTYLDSTHFFLSNTKDYKGSPYHIGEFRSRPFYNEVLSWLNSNKGKMAKGGGVDYNENREMVLNNNKQIAHHTKELQNAVKGKEVPAWVVAKVNRSTTDLSDSTHYMEGQGKSYADGGSIKIGDKVMLPEIKMRDGRIQFEKVENGEVIEIQDGIYSVLNPKTNRINKVSINQIKFNNGGSLDEFLDKKRMELNSYSDERIAKLFSDLMDIDYTDTLIELEGNAGERRDMIKKLMDELTIRHNIKNKNKFEGGGVLNGNYLDTISADKKNKILKNIANNYGFSIAEALAEVVDADAEMLYEYIANDKSLRMSVYNDFEYGKFAKGNTVKGLSGKDKFIADQLYYVISLKSILEKKNTIKNSLLPSINDYNLDEMTKKITKDNLEYALQQKSISDINRVLKTSINALIEEKK